MNIKIPSFVKDIFFQNNALASIITNADLKIVGINKAACAFLNYEEKDVFGKTIQVLESDEHKTLLNFNLKKLLSKEIEQYNYVSHFKFNNDKITILDFNFSIICDEKKSENYISIIITPSKVSNTSYYLGLDINDFHTILEKSPVIQYVLDIANDVNIYENKSLMSYLGYTVKDLNGKSEFDFLDSKILVEDFNDFKRSVNRYKYSTHPGDKLEIEYRIINKKGNIVWLYDKSEALKLNDDGTKKYSFGIILDITHRKNSEVHIYEQQLLIEKISQSYPNFIYLFNPETQEVFFSNKKSKKILGYTEKEFNEITREELIHPKNFVEYSRKINTFLKSKKETQFEYIAKLKHKNNGYKWFELNSVIFERDENNKPKLLLNTLINIDKKVVQKQKNLEKDLFIRDVTSKLPIKLYVVDLNTDVILFSNVKEKENQCFTTDETDLRTNYLINPEHSRDLENKKWALIANNKNNTLSCDVLIKHREKAYRWHNVKIKIFRRNAFNEPIQILKIVEDIHDEVEKNKQLLDQQELINSITNSIHSKLFLFDLEKNSYIYTNFENKDILGFSKDEFLNESLVQLLHPNFKEVFLIIKKEIHVNLYKSNYEAELLIKHKTLGYRWCSYKKVIIGRNEKGKPSKILEIIEDIHDLKRKTLQISEQQNLIEKISTLIPEFIYLKDYNTNKLIFSNHKCKDILGYDDVFFVSSNKDKFVHRDFLSKLQKYQKSIGENKSDNHFELDLLINHNNKGYRWYKNKTIIFERDENMNVSKTLELISDIHEAKINIDKIEGQQRFIENISVTIPQFLSVYNLENKQCLYTNFDHKEIFGYTQEEYLKISNAIIHPDYQELTKKSVENIIKTQNITANTIEFQLKHKTKGYIWVKLKILITKRNKEGKPIQALEIIEDIDESKKNFLQILEQQNFIQKIAYTIPNIIQVTNINLTKIIFTNFENREFLGYTKDKWEKTGLDIILPTQYHNYKRDIIELIKENSKRIAFHELQVKDSNGQYKWILAINTIFKRDDNRATQMLSIFRDINEQKELQLKLEKQLSKNIELERFASITSHDLKEPLRTLGTYAQILKNDYAKELDENVQELLNYIAKSSMRMGELINDILDFSKIETEGKKFEKLDLYDLIKTVKDDLKEQIVSKNALIYHDELPIILGDKTQLRQVFQNLISNLQIMINL